MNIDFARCEFGQEEKDAVNRVMSGYWLASGPENEAFEHEFAEYVGAKYGVCCNSGSSANLLALASLNMAKGAKVLTSGCGFPATLSPALHLGLKPVLVDYDILTHNADLLEVEQKMEDCEALILAHTLGSPLDMKRIMDIANAFHVAIIEDCCEALGTRIGGRHVGTFGDLGTYSFYPAHQMTALGAGGMVVTDDEELYKRMKSMRDWGKMYDWDSSQGGVTTHYTTTVDGEPYYKGYTYTHLGWNMKLPEANCAFGREQLKRLNGFVEARKFNYRYLENGLKKISSFLPIHYDTTADISWFGYPMTFKDAGHRNKFGEYLEEKGIRHRPFFAGNITRHAPFKHLEGNFPVADKLMADSLFVGCWPGLTKDRLDYMIEVIRAYFIHS